MSNDAFLDESQDARPEPTYEVGYGKPPVHSRFQPGQSGNKGRRKKDNDRRETRRDIVKRIRDERIKVGGKDMSMFELAVRKTFNATIQSGKPRDLKALLEMLDTYGAGINQDDTDERTPEEIAQAIRRAFQVAERISGNSDN